MTTRTLTKTRLGWFAVWLLACCPAVADSPSLADAFALIRSRPKIDLTHAFSAATPVWSGFGQARMTPAVDPQTLEAYTIARDGFRATYFAMVGPYGTHVDPPARGAPDGRYLDEIPLDEMILPLVVLDDTPFQSADPTHAFSVDDLAAFEQAHGRIPQGAFVALRTDMSKDWSSDPARYKRQPFPGWSLPVLQVLFEQRGVTAIGHESLDTDATKSMESETYVLGHGHWQIAALTNLDKVPATGAFIVASWPKPKAGLGFPARAFAIVSTTLADAAQAEQLARALVELRLAACAQICPVRSIYRWNGAVEEASEFLLSLKIVASEFAAVDDAIRARHPYDVPELVMTPITAGAAPYLAWLAAATRRADGPP